MTVGGTTLGYSLIGSWNMASPPAMTSTSESTAAKIGRVMKNDENFMTACLSPGYCALVAAGAAAATPPAPGFRSIATRSGAIVTPGRTRWSPFTTTTSPGVQAGAHDAEAVDDGPERHGAIAHGLGLVHDEHEPLVEVGADGAILNQQAAVAAAADQPQPDEQARREAAIGVAEHRAAVNGAGRGIHLVVEEVHLAHARIVLIAGERHVDGDAGLPRAGALAGAGEIAVAQEGLFVGVERGVDRIERHDGGQQRRLAGAARHQVAFGDDGAAHAPVDGRRDARELEIELRRAQRRFDRGHLRLRFLGGRGAALAFFQ